MRGNVTKCQWSCEFELIIVKIISSVFVGRDQCIFLFFMLPAGWNAEEETGAHQESSVCMLHTQIRCSAQKSHQQTNFWYLNWPLSVFQMCARSHHSGHPTADLYGQLPFPDPEASFLPSILKQQPPSTQNLLWPLQVSKASAQKPSTDVVCAAAEHDSPLESIYFPFLSFFPLFSIVLVESIPEGLEFNSSTVHPSIFQAWLGLLEEAHSSIDIASFYWTLTNSDTGTQEPTAEQVSWSCWWLGIRNASEDGFSLRRVVYFVLRVRPFWRGWLSCQGNWRFVLQWTHLRSLKTMTSGSSTTQVTLTGD